MKATDRAARTASVTWRLIEGDSREVLASLPAQSVQTCVTSPPYFGLRDYGHDGQIGLEPTPDEFVAALVGVFREVRRVLRDDGTVWCNLGDSYANNGQTGLNVNSGKSTLGPKRDGLGEKNAAWERTRPPQIVPAGCKPKDLLGIPWMVAFALRADGWYLRSDIVWSKPNPMPESVTDRPTKAHEYLFLLSKGPRYFYDHVAIREQSDPDQAAHDQRYAKVYDGPSTDPANGQPGNVNNGGIHSRAATDGKANKRSVWRVASTPFAGAHFATFPPKLIEPCILAGSPAHCCAQCRLPVVLDSPHARATETRTTDSDLRGVRERVSAGSCQQDGTLLFEDMCEPAHGCSPGFDAGMGEKREGIHPRQGTGSPDGGSGWLRDAAPPSNGGALGARVDPIGDRASPEWPQGRQPPVESGAARQVDPRQDPQTGAEADHLSALRRADQGLWACPACGCDEVAPSLVLDPFAGAGTTGVVALRHGRSFVGVELNPEYAELARRRICDDAPLLNTPAEVAA